MFPLFTNKENKITNTFNASRWLKYIFISFAQAVFQEYEEYKWHKDRRLTKIIIQDKFVNNNITPEKMPQIIFTRGSQVISRTSLDSTIGQETINRKYQKMETDIIRTSGSYSCLATSPTVSEHIADFLFLSLFIFRDSFRSKGIRDIQTISLGEINPIKMYAGGAEIEIYNTPINVQYNFQFEYLKHLYQEHYPVFKEMDLIISGYPEDFTNQPPYPLISGYILPDVYPVNTDPFYKKILVSGQENLYNLEDMDLRT